MYCLHTIRTLVVVGGVVLLNSTQHLSDDMHACQLLQVDFYPGL